MSGAWRRTELLSLQKPAWVHAESEQSERLPGSLGLTEKKGNELEQRKNYAAGKCPI